MTTSDTSLLTRHEVAALLKVTVRTIERWEAAGTLTPLRIGRNVRYRAADVEEFIAAHADGAA